MKKILVSLVSEQTVPNVLVACHVKPDILWFVSTKRMETEQRTKFILETLAMKGVHSERQTPPVIVDQDSLEDCANRIESLIETEDDESEYIVNITGGNKVMALAAYEAFRDTGRKITVCYMPLGKNEIVQVFPRKKPLKVSSVKERLNLPEYLRAYGFALSNMDSIMRAKERALARRDISDYILNNFENVRGLFSYFYSQLKDCRKKSSLSFSAEYDGELSSSEVECLRMLGFAVSGRTLEKRMQKHEITFVTGGWLEEYVFSTIYDLREAHLVDDVQTGIQITSSGGSSNELDIAFMKENVFFHIECKSLGTGTDPDRRAAPAIVRDELYKKGALSALLGKGDRRAYICTTLTHISDDLASRAREYGLEIYELNQVRQLKSILSERLSR